jgi:malate dehydrogenase
MERKELLAKNVEIISAHAAALDELASRDVRVVVVANPANTLALVAKKTAASLPSENFSCLTRLDHDRLRGAVAKKLTALRPPGCEVTAMQVRNAVIWGNHSSTQVPSAAQVRLPRTCRVSACSHEMCWWGERG